MAATFNADYNVENDRMQIVAGTRTITDPGETTRCVSIFFTLSKHRFRTGKILAYPFSCLLVSGLLQLLVILKAHH